MGREEQQNYRKMKQSGARSAPNFWGEFGAKALENLRKMKENEAAGTIPEVFCNLAGPFSFLWAFVFFWPEAGLLRGEAWRGGICFFEAWAVCFSGPVFFFGGSEASFPGWGLDGKPARIKKAASGRCVVGREGPARARQPRPVVLCWPQRLGKP